MLQYRFQHDQKKEDFSSANDLAAKEANKLKQLQNLFLAQAREYNVLPNKLPNKWSGRFGNTIRTSTPRIVANFKAVQAFDNLMYGLATNNWAPLLNLLTDDFTFWFPVGKYHGLNVGKERVKEFFQYVTEAFGQTLKLTSLERVTSSETTVVFEFCDEGIVQGQPYKNCIAISFDVRGDKICGYREYFGSDGKSN